METSIPQLKTSSKGTSWLKIFLVGFALLLFFILMLFVGVMIYRAFKKSGPGDNCEEDANCESGLFCYQRGCRKIRNEGETCEFTQECVPSLICNRLTSTCLPKSQLGGKCQVRDDCEAGLICSPSKTCKK